MSTTVFNCTNDDLTVQAFCFFAHKSGVMAHLTDKDLPEESVNTNEFTPYILGQNEAFDAKDRVVFVWREGEAKYEMYAFGKYDVLSELRLEVKLRKHKGPMVIYKGLRDLDDSIHFYRRTEHGKPFTSRYFGIASAQA
jgi:hypothetical protein